MTFGFSQMLSQVIHSVNRCEYLMQRLLGHQRSCHIHLREPRLLIEHGSHSLIDGRHGGLAVLAQVHLLSESDHASECKHCSGHHDLSLDVLVGAVATHERVLAIVLQVNYLDESKANNVHGHKEEEHAERDVGGIYPVSVIELSDKVGF